MLVSSSCAPEVAATTTAIAAQDNSAVLAVGNDADGALVGSGLTSLLVAGEVDASNADRLRSAIVHAASGGSCPGIEVDLAGVTFMDSTGLRAMVDASLALEPSGSPLVLRNVPRHVRRILDIVDISRSLEARE